MLSSEAYSESLFDGEHPDHHLHPCSIWAGLAAIQALGSVGLRKYMSDKWYCRFHMPGEGDVHCSRGNAIERCKMKHSSKDADRWLYRVRADVAIEGQGDDVLFNDIWEQCMNTNGCFHFFSSLCLPVLVQGSTVWCLGWNGKTDESRYDVCPVRLLPLHHRASTAWVMMMRAAWTVAYYFTMEADNGGSLLWCWKNQFRYPITAVRIHLNVTQKHKEFFQNLAESEDANLKRSRVMRKPMNLHKSMANYIDHC